MIGAGDRGRTGDVQLGKLRETDTASTRIIPIRDTEPTYNSDQIETVPKLTRFFHLTNPDFFPNI